MTTLWFKLHDLSDVKYCSNKIDMILRQKKTWKIQSSNGEQKSWWKMYGLKTQHNVKDAQESNDGEFVLWNIVDSRG